MYATNNINLLLHEVCQTHIILFHYLYVHNRKLWSMRNYIHIMLCSNLFIAQLTFLIGVDKTENKVKTTEIIRYVILLGCLLNHCCCTPVHVSSNIHVDVNGRSGFIHNVS